MSVQTDLRRLVRHLVGTGITPPTGNKDGSAREQVEALVVQLLESGTANPLTGSATGSLGQQIAKASAAGVLAQYNISTAHDWSVGPQLLRYAASPFSAPAAWDSANRAVYVPVYLQVGMTLKQLWAANGGTANGNTDIGLYNSSATTFLPTTKVVTAGSTAQSGTTTLQLYDVADQVLSAGLYYFAYVNSGLTGTVYAYTSVIPFTRSLGVYVEAAALPLPATATPVTVAANQLIPLVGFTGATTF